MASFQRGGEVGSAVLIKDSGPNSKPSQFWDCYRSESLVVKNRNYLWVLADGYWIFWLEIQRAGPRLSGKLQSLEDASPCPENGVCLLGIRFSYWLCPITCGFPLNQETEKHDCLLSLSMLMPLGLGKATYMFGFPLSSIIEGEDLASPTTSVL